MIPGDGDVIEGIASVDESVITGESAPVIRESGGDRSAVTGGTKVLSDYIKIQITSNPGETFLDRMIALVEGAQRQKTPNEIALNIMIAGLTLIFLFAVVTLAPFAQYSVAQAKAGSRSECHRAGFAAGVSDSDNHRRIAFGHRHRGYGSRDAAQRARDERQGRGGGRRREHAAARQDRHHHAGQSAGRRVSARRMEFTPAELADAAQLSSLADETPEGRSIVVLAKEKYGLRGREIAEHQAEFIAFTAQTRMSGVNIEGRAIRKGATESVRQYVIGSWRTRFRSSVAILRSRFRAPAVRRWL